MSLKHRISIEVPLPSGSQWIRLPLGLLLELHPEEILMTSIIFWSASPWRVLWLVVLRLLYAEGIERITMMEVGMSAGNDVLKVLKCVSVKVLRRADVIEDSPTERMMRTRRIMVDERNIWEAARKIGGWVVSHTW